MYNFPGIRTRINKSRCLPDKKLYWLHYGNSISISIRISISISISSGIPAGLNEIYVAWRYVFAS